MDHIRYQLMQARRDELLRQAARPLVDHRAARRGKLRLMRRSILPLSRPVTD
jgi:hypothetical protein